MASTPATMLKIVSSGLEDITRLNPTEGQPSPTFYKTVIRQRTRWASQWRRVEFDNKADFGRTATVTLPILGELITRAVLVVVLPDIVTAQEQASQAVQSPVYPAWSWTNSIGHALCSSISMSISNSVIDTFDSRLLEIIDEQHSSFDHFDTTNFLIGRDPTSFNPLTYNSLQKTLSQIKTTIQTPQTVQVVPPFWWNRGVGPQALPIQALAKDTVQLSCTFRPVQSLVYTDYRVGYNTPISANEGVGPLPNIESAGFYYPTPSGTTLKQYGRDPATGMALPDILGTRVPGITMPAEYHFTDAYWIVEYVSLEEREAIAFRTADLQIPIETHDALQVAPTNGAAKTRIEIEQGGLVRDITWVAQRVEAPLYNAYFLFSRDLAPENASASETPWWPNAVFPSWDFGDGYITTGFSNTRSDPLLSATLRLGGKERFDFSGPSLFRSLMPILNCKRAPLVNRYIYRYDFGLWSTGGIAEAYDRPVDEVRGSANWDKIPTKDLEFSTATDYYVPTYTAIYTHLQFPTTPLFNQLYGNLFQVSTYSEAFRITLTGSGSGGRGAVITFTIDNQEIQNVDGFKNMYVRTIPDGSISLILQTTKGYSYIAVAGAGGQGSNGGNAGTILTCGLQGGTSVATHASTGVGGGGGGGRSYANMPTTAIKEGPGLPDGTAMTTDYSFLSTYTKTGGTQNGFQGGDGYYGGGSGTENGGGGGSYVSAFCSDVTVSSSQNSTASMFIDVLKKNTSVRPSFNIYAWLTTYNMLMISGGRGALMFM